MPQRKQLANTQGHTPFYPVAGGPGYFPWQGGEQLEGCSAACTVFRFAQHRSVVPLRVRPFRSPNTMHGAILSLYSSTNVLSSQGGGARFHPRSGLRFAPRMKSSPQLKLGVSAPIFR